MTPARSPPSGGTIGNTALSGMPEATGSMPGELANWGLMQTGSFAGSLIGSDVKGGFAHATSSTHRIAEERGGTGNPPRQRWSTSGDAEGLQSPAARGFRRSMISQIACTRIHLASPPPAHTSIGPAKPRWNASVQRPPLNSRPSSGPLRHRKPEPGLIAASATVR